MWPFKARNKFLPIFYMDLANVSFTLIAKISEKWEVGELERGEYVAMLYPTAGASELAKGFLSSDPKHPAPFKYLGRDDLPEETAAISGYIVLLTTLFGNLREQMRNLPEIANAVGISFDDLLKKYAAISGLDERMFTSYLSTMDQFLAENSGDIRVWWEQAIIDFGGTISKSGPRHKDSLEAMMFPGLIMDTMGLLAGNMRAVLEDGEKNSTRDLINALTG